MNNIELHNAIMNLPVSFGIDTQCKIAFAEMCSACVMPGDNWRAASNACLATNPFHVRFLAGERTPELLADMQRVTRELRGEE